MSSFDDLAGRLDGFNGQLEAKGLEPLALASFEEWQAEQESAEEE